MKILVTGGAGFIGSHLVDALCAADHQVSVLDNLSVGRSNFISHHFDINGFRFIRESILNERCVDEMVTDSDLVYHLAAAVGVSYIVRDPLNAILTNVRGTENVLTSAARHWKRVVIASSSEVYGKSDGRTLNEDMDRVLGPTSVTRWAYSASKAIDEHLAWAYHEQGLPVSVVRYFNCYGPRIDEHGYGSVVANFMRQALMNEPITVHNDGRQTRSFTYISDTVRGTILAGEKEEAIGKVFNIGNPVETSILDLAQLIKRLVGSNSPIIHIPYEDYYGQKYEDTPRRCPDITKAAELLGFSPQVPLTEGIECTIEWCRANYRSSLRRAGTRKYAEIATSTERSAA